MESSDGFAASSADQLVGLTFAILSDPHFIVDTGPGTSSSSHLKVRADGALASDRPGVNPWAGLNSLVESQGIVADALICPGDIATAGDRTGLAAGWRHLCDLGGRLTAKRVLCATGNHDIKSRSSAPAVKDAAIRALKQGYGLFEGLKLLTPPYPSVNLRGSDLATAKASRSKYFGDGLVLIEDERYQVLIVNSCCEHGHDAFEYDRGTFPVSSKHALEDALAACDPRKIGIAVAHHPPAIHGQGGEGEHDFIDNGSALLEALERHGAWLVLHGHKHEGRVKFAPGGGCSPIIFGAASLGAYLEETEGAFRNQFYLLTLNHDDHQQLRGRLRVWDWYQGHGWKPANRGGAGLYDGSGFGNRNVAATVAAVARAAQGNLPMTWEKVTQAVPDTAFLSVADEDIMISRLKTSHQITARFKADGSWETLEKALT